MYSSMFIIFSDITMNIFITVFFKPHF
uniref:Uncharacterized protein n=1 Tax=Anguilla anguilla TaxID=7936 RepID=A0A0E9TD64_ANGAN